MFSLPFCNTNTDSYLVYIKRRGEGGDGGGGVSSDVRFPDALLFRSSSENSATIVHPSPEHP